MHGRTARLGRRVLLRAQGGVPFHEMGFYYVIDLPPRSPLLDLGWRVSKKDGSVRIRLLLDLVGDAPLNLTFHPTFLTWGTCPHLRPYGARGAS